MLYFFDVHDGDDFDPDEIGTDLPSMEAAKSMAARALVDLARDNTEALVSRRLTLEVRDAEGRDLFKIALALELSEQASAQQPASPVRLSANR